MAVGPCVQKIFPKKGSNLVDLLLKLGQGRHRIIIFTPKTLSKALFLLLTYSRHSKVDFGTSYMRVGPCVPKKFEKIGGRYQKIAFFAKMAQKSHLNAPKSHINAPYGVLMPSTCSYHEYNRLKYQQGFNSNLF